MWPLLAEQGPGCYTVQFAPPELLRLYGQKNCKSLAAASHNMWALGAMFQQTLAATCQLGPLFLPDPQPAARAPASEREVVLLGLVAAEQEHWVGFLVVA